MNGNVPCRNDSSFPFWLHLGGKLEMKFFFFKIHLVSTPGNILSKVSCGFLGEEIMSQKSANGFQLLVRDMNLKGKKKIRVESMLASI